MKIREVIFWHGFVFGMLVGAAVLLCLIDSNAATERRAAQETYKAAILRTERHQRELRAEIARLREAMLPSAMPVHEHVVEVGE